ncbi:hypothetical protein BD770DRAFT_412834 [Pilaira anomala]|nr:hypothetical protein BD770DRAFT_412834 [Pilaira anomala]
MLIKCSICSSEFDTRASASENFKFMHEHELSVPSLYNSLEPEVRVSLDEAVGVLFPNNETNSHVIRNVLAALKLVLFDVRPDSSDDNEPQITALTVVDEHITFSYNYHIHKSLFLSIIRLSNPYAEATPLKNNYVHIKNSSNCTALNNIISRSLYGQILAFESYVYISEEQLQFLNAPWREKSWMFIAVSQLFSGAVLVDGNQALLINGVDPYSQYPSIDAHSDQVSSKPDHT